MTDDHNAATTFTFFNLDQKMLTFSYDVRSALYAHSGAVAGIPDTTFEEVLNHRRDRQAELQEQGNEIQELLDHCIETCPPSLLIPLLAFADRVSAWVVQGLSRLYDNALGPQKQLKETLQADQLWSRRWWRDMASILASAGRMEIAAQVSQGTLIERSAPIPQVGQTGQKNENPLSDPDMEWLMPPLSLKEIAAPLNITRDKAQDLLSPFSLQNFPPNNRQSWTFRLDKAPSTISEVFRRLRNSP